MSELEEKIATWRAQLVAALRGNRKAADELEEHLRDQIEVLRREGKSADEAFELAVRRLGKTGDLAREFSNLKSGWLPESWTIRAVLGLWFLLVGLNVAWALGLAEAVHSKRGFVMAPADPLLVVGSVVIGSGYLAVLATALIGMTALARMWRRPLLVGERSEFRQQMERLCRLSCCLVLPGMLLTLISSWAGKGGEYKWPNDDLGMLVGLMLTVLLWASQAGDIFTRPVWRLLPFLGSLFLAVGWLRLGPRGMTGGVPIGWLLVAFLVSQLAVAVLRSKQGRREESSIAG